MRLILERINKQSNLTIGRLTIYLDDGTKIFWCDTLEDKDRGLTQDMSLSRIKTIKIVGQTAIPTGTYTISMDVVSPKFSSLEPYKSIAKGKVPRLLNVPGFEGIVIHIGNWPNDTTGCILVGTATNNSVLNSTDTWKKLYTFLKVARLKNETIIIEIK